MTTDLAGAIAACTRQMALTARLNEGLALAKRHLAAGDLDGCLNELEATAAQVERLDQ